jgi:tetratricopeptide (TPR) repeat protein
MFMRVACVISLAVAGAAASSLSAQIPTKRASQATVANATRMLVGNPHSYNAQDSATSVAVGEGVRLRLDKATNGQFRVLTRKEMNEALQQFGYPSDAILGPLPFRAFAQSLNARATVFSSLSKDKGNTYTITARLSGMNDDAGNVVTVVQAAGQVPPDLGSRVADGFTSAMKSWNDARACVDQSKAAPEKAMQAARKAIAVLPTHGLANFCLGKLIQSKGTKSDSAEAMGYFQTAVKGDPLSLAAWTELASGYELADDTVKTIAALRQMLLIAPTNQPLRELAFKKFLFYGHPEIAEQVANDGLQLDPGNVDLYELRANARVFLENYDGALSDLDQIVALDSTRADSTFYVKYLVFAGQRPDTARLITWSSRALHKFPENLSLVKQAAGGYAQVGAKDSLLGVLSLVLKGDSSAAVALALQEAKTLQDLKAYDAAMPFIEFAAAHADAQSRESVAGLLLNATFPKLQPPPDWPGATVGMRKVLQYASPSGQFAPLANYFLGLSLVNQITGLDQEAEKTKSCDGARQVEAMEAEADAALSHTGEYQKDTRDKLAGYLTGLKPRTASMLRVYCK